MADSLVLTGVKDIKKHTGTEMLLTRPKRGGDTHSVKEWWKSGVSTVYTECTVFNVTVGGNSCKLVLDTNASTNMRIDHDGAFNFTFYGINEISRGALFTASYELIEHYVFPRISGGKVMTVIPADAAAKPGVGPAPKTIGSLTINGASTADDGDTETYSFSIGGNADDAIGNWTSSEGTDVISGNDITYNGTGERTITLTVTATASDSPATETTTVTIS